MLTKTESLLKLFCNYNGIINKIKYIYLMFEYSVIALTIKCCNIIKFSKSFLNSL